MGSQNVQSGQLYRISNTRLTATLPSSNFPSFSANLDSGAYFSKNLVRGIKKSVHKAVIISTVFSRKLKKNTGK